MKLEDLPANLRQEGFVMNDGKTRDIYLPGKQVDQLAAILNQKDEAKSA